MSETPNPGFTPEPVPAKLPVPAKAITPPTTEQRLDALEFRVFGGPPEVNTQLIVGDTLTVPIGAVDAQDDVQPLPVGDTFSARSSVPTAMDAGISALAGGGPALVITAKAPGERVLAFVSDTKGLTTVTERFNISLPPVEPPPPPPEPSTAPVALTLDMGAAVKIEAETEAEKKA